MDNTIHIPAISIVTAVYNNTEYLPDYFDSMLHQGVDDIEIILVEDHSTDDGATLRLIQKYTSRDARIKILRTPYNMGAAKARNIGLKQARGKYVIFVDSDDTIEPGSLAKCLEAARQHNADIVRFGYACMVEGVRYEQKYRPVGDSFISDDPSVLRQVAFCIFSSPVEPGGSDLNFGGSAWCAIFRREILVQNNIEFSDVLLGEDLFFCYQFMMNAHKMVYIPRDYYNYRIVGSSVTNNVKTDYIDKLLLSAKHFMATVRQDVSVTPQEINLIRGYVVLSLRGILKKIFMSKGMTLRQKRQWFRRQQADPLMEECYCIYPWQNLPFKHRIGFKYFYKQRFYLLYTLIVGQECVRKLLGRKF